MIWSAEQLGPTFIKLAQWASTRPDLFPPHLTERLEKLQDGVEVQYPFSYVENTLDESFGTDWRTQMVVDSQPIGSGCVAQVFKGTTLVETTFTSLPGTASKAKSKAAMLLKNSKGDATATVESIPAGTKVAIKLIHPHVEKLVRQDMELLGSIGELSSVQLIVCIDPMCVALSNYICVYITTSTSTSTSIRRHIGYSCQAGNCVCG